MLKLILNSILVALIGFQLISCSSSEKKETETAEIFFAKAQELEKEERFEEAIRKYNDVKNKFPYSKLAPQAELAVADVHYKQEAYPEAQAAYQIFKELHPKHPQVDYVTHKLGMSYFNQLPSSIDRDLTIANQAISIFNEVIKNYPRSEYVKEAQEKRLEAIRMLAEKEIYIANFYYKKEKWQSALDRYLDSAKLHQGLGFDELALTQAKDTAQKTGATKSLAVFNKLVPEKKSNP